MSRIESVQAEKTEESEFSWLAALVDSMVHNTAMPLFGRLGDTILASGGSLNVTAQAYPNLLILITYLEIADRPLPKIQRSSVEDQRRYEQEERSLRKEEDRRKVAGKIKPIEVQRGHQTARKDSSLPGYVYDHNFNIRGAGSRLTA